MKIRSAGKTRTIGIAALACVLASLACVPAMAADVERQIPVIRDTEGSGLTTEISRDGNRQTATPFLTLCGPTVRRVEDRIGEKTARLAAKETPPDARAADSRSRIDQTGTPREDSGRAETTLATLPPLPGEITIRNVKGFLKGLRASRKEKPVPAEVVPAPEVRLGMFDASMR